MASPDRVRTKLGHLEEYVGGLAAKQDRSKTTYLEDPDVRDIVERRFEKSIQASLDIASHIVSEEGYREPSDYGDLFRVLAEEQVLSPPVADVMVDMAGFRNVLAHEYSTIDDELVYEQLQDLERFRSFATEIEAFLQEKEG